VSNLVKTAAITEAPSTQTREHGPGLGFFAVGMVINIVLIVAFFVWAVKQRRNKKKQDE